MRFVWLLTAFFVAAPALAQSPANESAKKARELLDQVVTALGGAAFRSLKTARLEGRLYAFRRGDLSGLAQVVEYVRYPDKQREEYGQNKEEIQIVNGDKGWTVDINGVKPLSTEEMKEYHEAESLRAFYILRYRLGEAGSTVEYAGRELWENREVDLVRFFDAENRAVTISLDRSTHLPGRAVRVRRDPKTRERIEETEIFSNYFTSNGVTAPRHLMRLRNGNRIFEAFIREVRYNMELPESLFTPPPR